VNLEVCRHAEGVTLPVRLQPGARRTAVLGVHGGALRVAVAAKPVEGQANEALLTVLRQLFRLNRGDVALLRGERSRDKVVLLRGVSAETVAAAIS
jgi:uncharacterized protein (TIGR00251 family)